MVDWPIEFCVCVLLLAASGTCIAIGRYFSNRAAGTSQKATTLWDVLYLIFTKR